MAEVNSTLSKSQWALSSQDRTEKGTLSYIQVLLEVSQVMVLRLSPCGGSGRDFDLHSQMLKEMITMSMSPHSNKLA